MKKLLPIIVILLISTSAYAQDPGMPDSVAFGFPDGSPVLANIDQTAQIGFWVKCDENIAFMNFCMATEDEYVPFRYYAYAINEFADWNVLGTFPTIDSPGPGLTSQAIFGTADFTQSPPNFVNTQGEWVQLGYFVIRTTDDQQYLGASCDLHAGYDPLQGETVLFNQYWTPIHPAIVTSTILFQSSYAPEIIAPAGDTTVIIGDHYPFSFYLDAVDDDDDHIFLDVEFPYSNYELDTIIDNAGAATYRFSWVPDIGQSIVSEALFIASDTNSLADTLVMTFDVRSVTLSESIDSILPGYDAEIDLTIDIGAPNVNVGGFNLFLTWDYTILDYAGVQFGDVFDNWDYLDVTPNAYGPGTMVLLGLANLNQQHNPPLFEGEHFLATITFETPLNTDLQGITLPIHLPTNDPTRNVFSDSIGYSSYQPVIHPGGVRFMTFDEILLGDINLNLIPYEMGDAVVFIDHLSDPIGHPFNNTQSMASDCNQDLIPETIADLICMLDIINNGGGAAPSNYPQMSASLELATSSFEGFVTLVGDQGAGAALVVIEHKGCELADVITADGLNISYSDRNGVLTAVIYSDNGTTLKNDILYFDVNGTPDNLEISRYEISDPYGQLIK